MSAPKYELPVRREKDKNLILINEEGQARRDIVFDFNKHLKWLMKRIYALGLKTVQLESAMNQVSIAIEEDAEFIIQNLGPELYRFKNILDKKDIDFFIEKINMKELYGHLPHYEDNLIVFIQRELKNMNSADKDIIFTRINLMLETYMQFSIFEMIDPLLNWKIADINKPADPETYKFKFITRNEYRQMVKDNRVAGKGEI